MKKIFMCLLFFGTSYLFAFGLVVENNGFVFLGNISPSQSEYDAGFNYGNATKVSVNVDPASDATLEIQADDFRGPSRMPVSCLRWQLSYLGANTLSSPYYIHSSANQYNGPGGAMSAQHDPTLASWLSSQSGQPFSAGIPAVAYKYFATDRGPGSAAYQGGMQCQFLFHILVPGNQQAGTYYSNVMFTLTP